MEMGGIMRKIKYFIIIMLIILISPIIPYENEIQDGVTKLEHKSIIEWVWTRYQSIQKAELEKVKVP